MTNDLILKNGRVVTRAGEVAGGVAVRDGTIVAVGPNQTLGTARRTIDVDGKVIFPGMFDPHCHLGSGDERTWEYMARSFARDTQDCLVGGVTSIATTTVLTPDPLPENFRRTVRAAEGRSHVDYRVTCVVTCDQHVKDIRAAAALGCVSFKFYTGYCGCLAEKMGMNPEGIPPGVFYRACEEAAKTQKLPLMMIHAEEPTVRFMLAHRFKAAGRDSLLDWAEHSPEWAESVQVYQYGMITNDFGLPLYVVHISRAHTVDLVAHLQHQGYPIIGETLVSFLATTARDLMERGVGLFGKIQPPIRHQADQERLWGGIAEGVVTAIGTDTIPYTSRYKVGRPFWDARPGLNIQTLDSVPLLFTEALHRNRLDLPTLAKVTAENPARYFRAYPEKGVLAPGSDADIVVIDPDKDVVLGASRFLGGSDYSIWEGKQAKGLPVMTFLRGALVAQDGQIVAEPRGRLIPS
jgi:dihydropyrimidinase